MTRALSVSDAVIILLDDQLENGIMDDRFRLLEEQILRDLVDNPLPDMESIREHTTIKGEIPGTFKEYVKTDILLEPLRQRINTFVQPVPPEPEDIEEGNCGGSDGTE